MASVYLDEANAAEILDVNVVPVPSFLIVSSDAQWQRGNNSPVPFSSLETRWKSNTTFLNPFSSPLPLPNISGALLSNARVLTVVARSAGVINPFKNSPSLSSLEVRGVTGVAVEDDSSDSASRRRLRVFPVFPILVYNELSIFKIKKYNFDEG